MSQGYGANYADVIEKETVREFCPKEYDALMDAIDKDPLGQSMFGNSKGTPYKRSNVKVNRNAPCPCGSGRKFKKCCI